MVNSENPKSLPATLRADQNRQKVIGTRLRTLYANVAAQPTPESFLHLLEQADQSGKG